MSKSQKTKEHIIQKVAPIFNKKGYKGTSLSEITLATGMTKGAIYGNFKDKETLAIEAFNYNVRYVMSKIRLITDDIASPLSKLFAVSNFYRNYYQHQLEYGGCPILNVGIDSHGENSMMYQRVREVSLKLKASISKMISDGIVAKEIRDDVDAIKYGGLIFSIIEGAVFSSTILRDGQYLKDMMNHLDELINRELRIK